MRALFSYDNMTVTLSRGSSECLHISLSLQLMVILTLKLFIARRHPLAGQPALRNGTSAAGCILAGTSNTEAGHPVVYYCLQT